MKATYINPAEAIIDPLWDPPRSGLVQWTIAPGAAHGLRVYQNWCWVNFEWARRPAAGPALSMRRLFDVDCTGFDRLIVSVMAPQGSRLHLCAETDRGRREQTYAPAPALKKEQVLELDGAQRLLALTLELSPGADGVATGWINWVGLQNSAALPGYLATWDLLEASGGPYLKPADYVPAFAPAHGLAFSAAELEALRGRLADGADAAPFRAMAEAARAQTPETMIREYVNFWNDTRYCRERDHGNRLLTHGVNAAVAGLLFKDRELLRLGARHALALALCGHWDDGMICRFPGGVFEHRCFVQSLCVHEVALILDLAGDLLTDVGRDLLLRRIAEEGLGAMHFNSWKHEYIFHCNQLAWFAPGRLLGCLLLERTWPRVKPYTELAYGELIESLGYAVLPDGGYAEGPTYFTVVGRNAGIALYYYARSRGRPFAEVLPEPMRRTADFAAAVASTDDGADVIPICDAGPRVGLVTPAVMAMLLPDSQWVSLFRKAQQRGRKEATGAAVIGGVENLHDTLLAHVLAAQIPETEPEAPVFTALPEMGIMASVRRLGDATVKLFLMGNKAGAGHTHEDKGSFVLEFAGETFACDPGTCDYSNPLSAELKNCERHNMLIPTGTAERPHPVCPLPADVKPRGSGDAVAFHAEADLAAGWEPYYRRWTRTWGSPSPDRLEVMDTWTLAQGTGVEFYWNTRLPVTVVGRTITIQGARGRAVLHAPADAVVRVDELPLPDGVQRRIVIARAGQAGTLTVRVELGI